MKNIAKRFSFFLVLFCLFLSFSGTVQAQAVEFPDTGMLPDSPFYFLKSWGEGIRTFFTFGDINKAERFFELSERRLAESNALIEKGKPEVVEKTLERYQKQLTQALERAERAKERGENIDDVLARVAEQTLKHQEVLVDVYERVPEQAKTAIEMAMNSGVRGHEEALRAISDQKKEEIAERLDRARERVEAKREQLRERGVIVPETLREMLLEVEIEIGIEIPQEFKKVLDRLPGLSAKYRHTLINEVKGLEVKADVWQKGTKVRVEMKDDLEGTIVVLDLIDRGGWVYVPEINMAIIIDPEIYMGEIENITGADILYDPVVLGSEIVDGFDALIVRHTVYGTADLEHYWVEYEVTQWFAKDHALLLKAEIDREGEMTEIKISDIEFVDIPDEKFQLPAGVEIQEIPPEIFRLREDLEGMMEEMGIKDIMKDVEDIIETIDIEDPIRDVEDIEDVIEGIDTEDIMKDVEGMEDMIEEMDIEGMMEEIDLESMMDF